MTKNITNAAPLAAAAKAFNGAEEQRQLGIALSVVELAKAWDMPLMVHIDADTIERASLADYRFDRTKPDGRADGKYRSALMRAILSTLYGLSEDEHTDAVKVGFKRSFDGACALAYMPEFETVKAKGSALTNVPLALAIDLYDRHGELTDVGTKAVKAIEAVAAFQGEELTAQQVDDRLAKTTVACDGKVHPLFGKMPSASAIAAKLGDAARAADLLPAKVKRDRNRTEADENATFLAAVDLVTGVMGSAMGSDESPVAFTEEVEDKLRALRDALIGFYGC